MTTKIQELRALAPGRHPGARGSKSAHGLPAQSLPTIGRQIFGFLLSATSVMSACALIWTTFLQQQPQSEQRTSTEKIASAPKPDRPPSRQDGSPSPPGGADLTASIDAMKAKINAVGAAMTVKGDQSVDMRNRGLGGGLVVVDVKPRTGGFVVQSNARQGANLPQTPQFSTAVKTESDGKLTSATDDKLGAPIPIEVIDSDRNVATASTTPAPDIKAPVRGLRPKASRKKPGVSRAATTKARQHPAPR